MFPLISRSDWALTQITPPAIEPITLAEARLHLSVDQTADDSLITAAISSARDHLEGVLGRAFCVQTFELVRDNWPMIEDEIRIPRPRLQSVASLKYTDSSGAQTTWDAGNYIVDADSEPARICRAYSIPWPTAVLQPVSAIRVRYIAGDSREFTFTADASMDTITAAGHGLVNGADLILRSSATLPGGLAGDTRYYLVSAATDTFKLSATKGGAAINITDAGTGTHTAATSIPLALRQALLLLIGDFYADRESMSTAEFFENATLRRLTYRYKREFVHSR